MGFESSAGTPSYWEQMPKSDRDMAIALSLMQAGGNVLNANQPRRGQGTPSLGSLFGAGTMGAAEGFGNSLAASQQMRQQQAKDKAAQVQANLDLLKQAREMNSLQAQENYFNTLPPDQQQIARAMGPEYMKHAADMAFAPQRMGLSVQEAMGKAGMYFNPQTGQYQYMPGYAESQVGFEGDKARVRGMNTPMTVEPGGQVVIPGMSMGGGQGMPNMDTILNGIRTVESGGNASAVSPAGAMGPYQFMPDTAKRFGVQDPFDEEQARAGAGQYMNQLLNRYGGNLDYATKAYNWGEGNMDAWLRTGRGVNGQPMPEETQKYSQAVMSAMQKQGQGQNGLPPGVIYRDARPTENEIKREEAAKKVAEGERQQQRSAGVVLDNIDRAKGLASPFFSTGIGSYLSGVPGSSARDLATTVDTIRANVGFDRLQQMRDSSPTGGALGQVSEQENRLLQSVLGSLDQSQSNEQFLENLGRVESTYLDIVHGPGNWHRDKNGKAVVGQAPQQGAQQEQRPPLSSFSQGQQPAQNRPSLSSFYR